LGLVSPYLKAFVVACSNPLRFMKVPPELEDLMATIRGKVERFNIEKIRQEDRLGAGLRGPPRAARAAAAER
jgi:ParB family chromosome partitioning protein